MPAYDFSCRACGAAFEVRLSMSAYSNGEGRACTECGSVDVERKFTAVNVIAGTGSHGGSYGGANSLGCGANGCGTSGFT